MSPDVVGIGALNLDFRVSAVAPELVPEWGTERSVDAATIDAVVAAAGGSVTLGGSAFNTIQAIAYAHRGLRLGYVGVAGRVPPGAPSALGELDALGVDRRYVFRADALGGTCVSVMRDGERTLLTHAGANATFADHVDREFGALAAYLGRARLLHVTSFLDDRSPGRLFALLSAVKAANTGTLLSVDPGHVWCTGPTPDILGIIGLADYLLVNRRERAALGDRIAGHTIVVVKSPGGVAWNGGEHARPPLPAAEIADATGAGDVFAAGLLLELARDPARIGAGCELGLRLARHGLRHHGRDGHPDFARLSQPGRLSGPV